MLSAANKGRWRRSKIMTGGKDNPPPRQKKPNQEKDMASSSVI
jgi:hypothetical protein